MEEYVCGEREVCVYIMNNGSGVVFSLGGGVYSSKGSAVPVGGEEEWGGAHGGLSVCGGVSVGAVRPSGL